MQLNKSTLSGLLLVIASHNIFHDQVERLICGSEKAVGLPDSREECGLRVIVCMPSGIVEVGDAEGSDLGLHKFAWVCVIAGAI